MQARTTPTEAATLDLRHQPNLLTRATPRHGSPHVRKPLQTARRIGAISAVALHVAVVAALVIPAPAPRSLALETTPFMVDWIAPARAPEVRQQPRPPVEQPHVERQASLQPAAASPREVSTTAVAPAQVPAAPSAPAAAPAPEPVTAVPPAVTAPAVQATTPPVFSAGYLDNPSPPYPAQSRRMGEQGRVILRVLVNGAGHAEEVQLHASSGSNRLDESARDTVRRWKFLPARRGAEPVAAWVLVPISFKLQG